MNCNKCNEDKNLSDFRFVKDPRYKAGGYRRRDCLECENIARQERRGIRR